jgi:hypothetical protein
MEILHRRMWSNPRQERFLRYVTRRAEDARKKKPGHSGRNDGPTRVPLEARRDYQRNPREQPGMAVLRVVIELWRLGYFGSVGLGTMAARAAAKRGTLL